MSFDELGRYQPSIRERILAAVLTLVTAALGLAEWLFLRTIVQYFFVLIELSRWAWDWWLDVSMLVLGVSWLVLVYISGALYHKALADKRLWRVFGRVSLIQFLVPGALVACLYLVAYIT